MSEKDNNNKSTLLCPYTKRFESIFVCALNCKNKCRQYLNNIDYSVLEEFVRLHPEYEIIGELMATNNSNNVKKKVKEYWVIDNDGKVEKVKEQDIFNNPQNFLDKEIWDKPPNQYEIVVALKRKR